MSERTSWTTLASKRVLIHQLAPCQKLFLISSFSDSGTKKIVINQYRSEKYVVTCPRVDKYPMSDIFFSLRTPPPNPLHGKHFCFTSKINILEAPALTFLSFLSSLESTCRRPVKIFPPALQRTECFPTSQQVKKKGASFSSFNTG